jgi:hypothetical protein
VSCEQTPGKVAALAHKGGVARLVSKRSFYLGAAGILALAASKAVPHLYRDLASRRAERGRPQMSWPGAQQGEYVAHRRVPALPARALAMPAAGKMLTGRRCFNCQAAAGSKPGLYQI